MRKNYTSEILRGGWGVWYQGTYLQMDITNWQPSFLKVVFINTDKLYDIIYIYIYIYTPVKV